MVNFKKVFFVLLLTLQAALALADEPKVTITFYDETLVPGKPIQGLITVVHSNKDTVNADSFRLKDQRLNPTFLKKTDIGDGVSMSIFQFAIAAQPKGLYVLPPISLKVGSSDVQTPSMTYEVKSDGKNVPDSNATAKTKEGTPVVFTLKTFVEGKNQLYPGQKVTVGYFYLFNNNIEISKEHLPLIDTPDFKKIGSQKVNNYKQSDLGVRQITQELKADKPGNYSLGPSFVEGRVYRQGPNLEKQYVSDTIQATAPAVNLLVKAFPDKGKPASFNGAIGEDLQFKVELQSLPELSVGDKLTISLAISGKGDFENMPMPDVCCQPGFPGKFRLSDLPPVETMKGNTKYFVIDLMPLSSSIKALPPIEFSYFNLKSEMYTTLKSPAIPITVHEAPKGVTPIESEVPEKEKSKAGPAFPKTTPSPEALEISTITKLTPGDLLPRFFGTLTVFWMIPLGLLALFLQLDYKRRRGQTKTKEVIKTAEEIINEADESNLYSALEKALILQLYEKGEISSPELSSHELPDSGFSKVVKDFLGRREEERFSGKAPPNPALLKKEGEALLKKIKNSNGE